MKSKAKSPTVPMVDPYLEGLMGKLLDRLVSLEKKMDMVISQIARSISGSHEAPRQVHVHDSHPQERHDRVLYEAVCAECNKACKVPFRPTQDRAVYCKECFAKRKSGSSNLAGKPDMPVQTSPAAMPRGPIAKPATAQPQPAPSASKAPKKSAKPATAKKAKREKK